MEWIRISEWLGLTNGVRSKSGWWDRWDEWEDSVEEQLQRMSWDRTVKEWSSETYAGRQEGLSGLASGPGRSETYTAHSSAHLCCADNCRIPHRSRYPSSDKRPDQSGSSPHGHDTHTLQNRAANGSRVTNSRTVKGQYGYIMSKSVDLTK